MDISLPQEYKILLRWVNHHLSESGSDRRVNNFTSDFKDSVAYTRMLSHDFFFLTYYSVASPVVTTNM